MQLLESPEPDVDAELDTIRRIEETLAALPPPSRSRAAPVAIGLGSVALVGLAWVTPISTVGLQTAVALAAEVAALEVTLARDWRWTGSAPLAPGHIDVRHAETHLSDPGLAPGAEDATAGLAVEAEDARLRLLAGSAGARLAIETSPEGDLAVFLTGDAEAAIMFAGAGAIGPSGSGRPFTIEVPELLRFHPAADSRVPTMASFRLAAPLELQNLEITAISFGRLESIEDGFVSTLRSGRLYLPQVGRSDELVGADGVVFDRLEAAVTLVRLGDPRALEVQLQGTAARVDTIRGGHVRRATPSLLSYLYDNQRVAFFFASLSCLWASLWSAHRLLLQ